MKVNSAKTAKHYIGIDVHKEKTSLALADPVAAGKSACVAKNSVNHRRRRSCVPHFRHTLDCWPSFHGLAQYDNLSVPIYVVPIYAASRKLSLAGSAFHRAWIARVYGNEEAWMNEWENFLNQWIDKEPAAGSGD